MCELSPFTLFRLQFRRVYKRLNDDFYFLIVLFLQLKITEKLKMENKLCVCLEAKCTFKKKNIAFDY